MCQFVFASSAKLLQKRLCAGKQSWSEKCTFYNNNYLLTNGLGRRNITSSKENCNFRPGSCWGSCCLIKKRKPFFLFRKQQLPQQLPGRKLQFSCGFLYILATQAMCKRVVVVQNHTCCQSNYPSASSPTHSYAHSRQRARPSQTPRHSARPPTTHPPFQTPTPPPSHVGQRSLA